ncbi:MAG: SAM-dependent methyltransferase [Gammaproteobacteria bacterium]|nr:SAM-dependent methyltransferase [Gammaproteobacteria bacterium]|tara:strand:+ start:3201 stop:3824 length:624 start_codon:yes stop_codon:yes gene_type:complete
MISNLYDKFVLPKLLDVCCSTKPINYQRNKIVPNAKGDILEVGIGSGLNIPYYDPKKINKIIGLDPSEELNEMAKENAAKSDINIDILIAGAEEIPLPSNSIDTVLITYTLCTIPNLADSLKEIKRVMKNDAEMIFCEHGIAPDLRIQNWQNKINPLWGKLFGGCNINRDIPKILVNSEFKIQTLEQMYLPSTPKIVGYNYWGLAKI